MDIETMTINQKIVGSLTLTSTNATATATIPSVNITKTQLAYCGDTGDSNPNVGTPSNWFLSLTNATTITGNRSIAASPSNASAAYDLTEWV